VAAPFRDAEFDILYGEGISREGDLLDLAVNNNIVEKSGSWFSYAGERIGQGRENARAFLKENKDTLAKLEAEVRKKMGIGPVMPQAATPQVAAPTAQTGTGARVTTMPTGTDGAKVAAGKR
jgi:recombination protein RecA